MGLSSALSRLLVVSEKYPDLKATAAFRDLQVQLEGTENRITVERGNFQQRRGLLQYGGELDAPRGFTPDSSASSPSRTLRRAEGSDVPPTVSFDFGSATPAPAK